jgi:hypothetical protein
MAQTHSGDSVVTRKRVIPAQPFVIQTNDATLKAWLDALVAASGDGSDLLSTADAQALWAARCLNTDTADSGSCYVVSAEAQKRIEAGRY